MKKYFLLGLICMALQIQSSAQSPKKTKIALQFSGHIATLKSQSNSAIANGASAGYSFGAIIDRFFEDNYAISTGFSIMQTGINDQFWGSTSAGPVKYDRSMRIQYLEIPFSLKLKTNPIGYMTYFGNIGLSNGFRLKSTYETTLNDQEVNNGNAKDYTSFFRSALVIGGGAEYNISGNTNIMFGLNYHNGFTNVLNGDGFAENNGTLTNDKPKAYTNFIELKIGIFF